MTQDLDKRSPATASTEPGVSTSAPGKTKIGATGTSMPSDIPARFNRSLILKNISIAVGGRRLFENLEVSVAPGETVTLMGPSGSGKSTLLKFLCGVLDPTFSVTGTVALNGTSLITMPAHERRIGILFQDALLFPHLTVGANIGFGLPSSVSRKERIKRINEALEQADMAGMADRDPATLSGGQQARAALMRTILSEPRALLLDEPFSRLDVPLRAKMRKFVFDHVKQAELPTILVTHDPADAEAAGGPVLSLNAFIA